MPFSSQVWKLQAYNSRTLEPEAGRSQIAVQLGRYREILSQKREKAFLFIFNSTMSHSINL